MLKTENWEQAADNKERRYEEWKEQLTALDMYDLLIENVPEEQQEEIMREAWEEENDA